MKRPEEYRKVAVIGCGFIGYSWGVVFARGGCSVAMCNRPSETLETVMDRIEAALDFLAREGVIETEEIPRITGRITVTDSLEEAV